MLEAPKLQTIKEHKNKYLNTICCIVLAPKFHQLGFDNIIQRFGYLDHRSSEDIHFYCVGYGGYWNKIDVPDMEKIGINKYQSGIDIPWAFSQIFFAEFINELERETNWKYSGGAELIVLDSNVDFSNCIIFNIDEMIEDKAISNPAKLFEVLIQYARKHKEIGSISRREIGKISGEEIINGIIEILPQPIKNIWNIWERGKHYTLANIKK